MMDINTMQTYLLPFLYGLYGVILLFKRPEMGSNMGFSIQRARQSEAAWNYTQRAAGVYCLAAAAILLLCANLLPLPTLAQIALELGLVAAMYPIVNGLVKRKFPD